MFLLSHWWSVCRPPTGIYLPVSFTDISEFSSRHPRELSRVFSPILAGTLLRKFHQHHSQFPRKFGTSLTVRFPVSSIRTTRDFPARPGAALMGRVPASFSSAPEGSFLPCRCSRRQFPACQPQPVASPSNSQLFRGQIHPPVRSRSQS